MYDPALHFFEVFAQGAVFGALLCFITMEFARAAAMARRTPRREMRPIDAEWTEVRDHPPPAGLRRLV